MVISDKRLILLEEVKSKLTELGKTVSTAESCTSGLLGANLTYLDGSSNYYMGGVCVYSNYAKVHILGVDSKIIEEFGAVSPETAVSMSENIRLKLNTNYGISITGIAGPSGGTPQKPIGTVWICISSMDNRVVENLKLSGNRDSIREDTVELVLKKLLGFISNKG